MSVEFCPGCDKPKPQYYCWDGRNLDCALRLPPRWVTDGASGVMGLWLILRDLHEKIAAVTEQLDQIAPRCICEQMRTMKGGGPKVFWTCEVHGFVAAEKPPEAAE